LLFLLRKLVRTQQLPSLLLVLLNAFAEKVPRVFLSRFRLAIAGTFLGYSILGHSQIRRTLGASSTPNPGHRKGGMGEGCLPWWYCRHFYNKTLPGFSLPTA
jgi:hypothetical protein